MADGNQTSEAQAWRPGAVSLIHVAFGLSVVASMAMAALTLGL